jgi:preprotein translocase subunit SecB
MKAEEIKNATESSETTQKTEIQINIQGQYIKDLSFHSPIVPKVFKELKEAPKIEFNLDIQVKDITEDQYEVTVVIKAEAIKDTEIMFAIDLQYSGLFEIKNVLDAEQKKQVLLVYCPNLIFPFARRIIADITRDAGFQPLMVNPVDFASVYLQHQQQEKNKSQAAIH